jgi:AraC family transcriptional regulator of adaptative response/methylated-DNA-[protein]-cysteine methyltransferase
MARHDLNDKTKPTSIDDRGTMRQVYYTVADCPLGRVLLAGTQRGVCAVCFGETDTELLVALREREAAAVRRDDRPLRPWLRATLDYLHGRMPDLKLPLDVRATAFQQRVWQELRRIPSGQTRSYSDVARSIGRPSAARAVARACATNPVALVTPCHRVVREDGSLGGYYWGLARKEQLLAGERTQHMPARHRSQSGGSTNRR